MISEPTVIILGAGASKEYGFPVGAELLLEMQRALSQDLRNNFCKHAICGLGNRKAERFTKKGLETIFDVDEIFTELQKGLLATKSIDEFLWRRNQDDLTKVAKLVIASVILRCEKASLPTLQSGLFSSRAA